KGRQPRRPCSHSSWWLAHLLWMVNSPKLATLSWRFEAIDVALNVRACGLSAFHLEEISGVGLQVFQLHSMRAPALAPGSLRCLVRIVYVATIVDTRASW